MRPRQRRGSREPGGPAQGESYADVLGQLKRTVDPDNSGVEIQGQHKTKDGGLLLRYRTKTVTGQNFKEELRQALGDDGQIKDMDPSSRLEILDLDETVTTKDVNDALQRETGVEQDRKVHIFGPNKRSQFMAVCELEDSHFQRLLSNGRIQIGWVYCRVRQRLLVTRCHKCLGYGHLKKDCTATDRQNNCWRCGLADHKMKDCRTEKKYISCFLCTGAAEAKTDHKPGSGKYAVFCGALEERRKLRLPP